MTFEERIERCKEKMNNGKVQYDVIGVYKDEETYEHYNGIMNPWSSGRHTVYPVAWKKEIKNIGSIFSEHASVLFFGTRFLNDSKFMKEEVVKTLEQFKYDPEKMKICAYKIVN